MKINERKIATIIVNTLISLLVCWMIFATVFCIIKINRLDKISSETQKQFSQFSNFATKDELDYAYRSAVRITQLSRDGYGIDKSFATVKFFYLLPYKKYRVIDIKVGDLMMLDYINCNDAVSCYQKRVKVGSEYDINLRFLNGERELYRKQHIKIMGSEIKADEHIKEFEGWIRDFEKHGYDTKRAIIVIDEKNNIWDGQHRASWLYWKYGPNHKVKVMQLYRLV